MARQLGEVGQEVDLLLLLDTPLAQRPPLTTKDRAQVKLQELKQRGPAYLSQWARDRFAWEVAQLQKRFAADAEETTHTRDQFQNEAIEKAFRDALPRYTVEPYDGSLVLFRPKQDRAYVLGDDRVLDRGQEWVWEDNGWSPYCRDIEVYEMPGDHDSMVLEPNVRVMAEQLRACIEEAASRLEKYPGPRASAYAEEHAYGPRS